jgi:ComF family protein
VAASTISRLRGANLFAPLLDVLYQQRCLLTGELISVADHGFSQAGFDSMPQTKFWLNQTDNEMMQRLSGDGAPSADAALAGFTFVKGTPTQHLVHVSKYEDQPKLCQRMGYLLGHVLAEANAFKEPPVFVPIPLHTKRMRERGYNQSERLAKGLADATGGSVAAHLLIRTRYTESQATKSREERHKNILDAFGTTGSIPTAVWLVDDVMTTGATLKECIRVLRAAGVTWVGVLTFAIAEVSTDNKAEEPINVDESASVSFE